MSIATSATFEVLRNNASTRKANANKSNPRGDSGAGSIVLSGAEAAQQKFIAIPRPVRDRIQTDRKRKVKSSDGVIVPCKRMGGVAERACLQANGVGTRAIIRRAGALSKAVESHTVNEVHSNESLLIAIQKTRRRNERSSKAKRSTKPKIPVTKATDTCPKAKVTCDELVVDENRLPLTRATQGRKAATKTVVTKECKASTPVVPPSMASCYNSSIQFLGAEAARSLHHHKELLRHTKSSIEMIRRQSERACTSMNPPWNDCILRKENARSGVGIMRPTSAAEAPCCGDNESAVKEDISHVSGVDEQGTHNCIHNTRQKVGKQVHVRGQAAARLSRKSITARVKTYRSRSYADARNIDRRRKTKNGRSIDGSVIGNNYNGLLWKPTFDAGLVVTAQTINTCGDGSKKCGREAKQRAILPAETAARKFMVGFVKTSSVWKGERDECGTGVNIQIPGSDDLRNKYGMRGPKNDAPTYMDVTDSVPTTSAQNVNCTQQRFSKQSARDAQSKNIADCSLHKKNLSNIEDASLMQRGLEKKGVGDDQSTEHQVKMQESLRNGSLQGSRDSANKTMMGSENKTGKDAKIEGDDIQNRSITQLSKNIDVQDKNEDKTMLRRCLENGCKQHNQNVQSKAAMQHSSTARSTVNEDVFKKSATMRGRQSVTFNTPKKEGVCASTNSEVATKNLKDECEDSLVDLDFLARQRRSATGDFKVDDLPIAEVVSVGYVQHTVDESVNENLLGSTCKGQASNFNLPKQPDNTWSQLNTLATICGYNIETQSRAGFTGRKADVFLFEFYIHLGNNVFTGYGVTLDEARKQCALPAVEYLKERYLREQARFERMLKLEIASSHIKPMCNVFMRNRTSDSYMIQGDEVNACLSNSLHSVLTRIKEYQMKCDCNQALRNFIQLLLRAIHRLVWGFSQPY